MEEIGSNTSQKVLSTNAMGKEKKYKLILIKGIHSGAKAIK
jgi:hypothetical protein